MWDCSDLEHDGCGFDSHSEERTILYFDFLAFKAFKASRVWWKLENGVSQYQFAIFSPPAPIFPHFQIWSVEVLSPNKLLIFLFLLICYWIDLLEYKKIEKKTSNTKLK